MRLFFVECKMIFRHKLYYLFCITLTVLFVWTARPFSVGENLEPLDEMHMLARTLLEDSEKEQMVNENLLDIAAICGDKKERDFLREHAYVDVSDAQRMAMQEYVQEVLDAIGDGNYTKEQVLAWNTEIFQKQEIHLTREEMDAILDGVDALLGGYTHFNEDSQYGNFRVACYEIGGYNATFQIEDGENNDFTVVPLSEAVKKYDAEVLKTAYTGMFAPYLCDKMGIILCMTAALVLAVFQLSLSAGMKELLSMRAAAAAKLIGIKYASVVTMIFIPVFLLMTAADIKICMQGMRFGYSVNLFTIPAFAVLWLLPEILFISASGMLLELVFDFMAVPFLLEAVLFGISIQDVYGQYGYSRVALRYNMLAHWDILQSCLPDILSNRLFYTGMSVLVFGLAVSIYHLQKFGYAAAASRWMQPFREGFASVYGKIKQELAEISPHIRKTGTARCRGIFYYQFKLGLWKGAVYCTLLDIGVYLLFSGDMPDLQIFQRFLPLNGLILFSVIGLAEREADCAAVAAMKNRVHVQAVQSVMAGALSVGFVLLMGTVLHQPVDVCLFVLGCALGLGCICSVLSKLAWGIIGGMFAAICIYIGAVIVYA